MLFSFFNGNGLFIYRTSIFKVSLQNQMEEEEEEEEEEPIVLCNMKLIVGAFNNLV